MKKILSYFFLILSFTLLTACGGGGSAPAAVVNLVGGQGNVAKGPFILDSSVTAYKLNADGTRSTTTATTTTSDNIGSYEFESISWSGATEVEVYGNYYDESTGATSANPTALTAIVDRVSGTAFTANINVFTHLEAQRIKFLMASSSSLADAKASAQAAIKTLFNLDLNNGTALTDLDLTEGLGENAQDNAELLRISAAIAADTASSGSLLANLETAIEDGDVQSDSAGSSALAALVVGAAAVDLDAVATAMQSSLGLTDAPTAADENPNNAPVITAISDQAKDEDAAAFDIALEVTDADSTDTPSFTSAFSSDPTKAAVSLSGSTLTITPVANASGSTIITVNATDGNLPTARSFTVNLTAVNDAPVIADIADQTKAEDAAAFDIALVVSDIDSNNPSFTTATAIDTSIITVALTGSTLTVTPLANATGSTTVTVTATDGTDTNQQTFTISLTPSNDAPVIAAIANQTKVEDATAFDVALTVTDIDSNNPSFTTATADSSKVTLSLTGSTLTVTPVENETGTTTITVNATDGTATATQTFTVDLTAVNDAPVIAAIANQTKVEDAAAFDVALTVTDIDSNNPSFTTATADTSKITLSLTGSTLTVTPVENETGTTTITVNATDGTATASQTFTVDLTAVNDPPVLADIANATKSYGDASFDVALSATDADNDSLSFSASSSNASTTVSVTGSTLTITPVSVGTSIITVIVNDGTITTNTTMTVSTGQKDVIITANAQSKVYGESDPTLDYTVSPALIGADTIAISFSGSLERVTATPADKAVGTHAINVGSLTAGANYNIASFVTADVTITERPITITVNDNLSKVYGDNGVETLGFTVSSALSPSLILGDATSGALARAVGEDVGAYAINQGTVDISTNYDIAFVPKNFAITPKLITVTPDSGLNKTYGNANPALPFTTAAGSLINGDTLNGTLAMTAILVGSSHPITIGTLAHSNYTITLDTVNFQIAQRPITITADSGQDKVYGDNDPALQHTITTGELVLGNTLSGSLSRVAGSTPGTYAITNGLVNINYNVTFIPANFTIHKRDVTITANANQTKIEGAAEPASYGFSLTSGQLVTGDATINGTLTRDAGETVGTYEITQNNLVLSANYNLHYVSADFTITAAPVANAGDNQSLVVNTPFTLDASSSTVPAAIASYVWSFNGGNIGTGVTLAVTAGDFPAGQHTVTLTTTDVANNTTTDDTVITIALPAPTNLTGTTGSTSAQLSWDAVTGVNYYTFYLASETFNSTIAAHNSLANASAGDSATNMSNITGLVNNVKFYFVVTATVVDGGGNHVESAPSNEVNGTPNPIAGNLVDPYIVGAVMYQDSNDDGIWNDVSGAVPAEPLSSATTAQGGYTFNSPLTPGAKICIKEQGTHEGKAYDVPLTGTVDADGNIDLVTPLTTLTSRGLTKQQLADILNHAALQNIYDDPDGHPEDVNHAHNGHFISAGTPIVVGGATWSITAAEIDLNPLAGNLLSTPFDDIIGDNAKQRELIKLQASITIAALIKIFEGSDALKDFDGTDLYENGFPHNDATHPLGADVAGSAFFDGNGHVAVLARNILKGVTDSLSLSILGNMEDSLAPLRNGLIAGSGGALDAVTVLAVAPKVNFDLTSKVAVTFVERLAEAGFTACNAQVTDDDGNGDTTDDKIRAALEALGTTQSVISSVVFGDLAPKLYGMKHQAALEPYRAAIAAAGGTTLIAGMDAKIAGDVTFRFNGSNQLVAQ